MESNYLDKNNASKQEAPMPTNISPSNISQGSENVNSKKS